MNTFRSFSAQSAHIFSTDLGRKPQRPATDPSTRPIPACVIARSNPQDDAKRFAEDLRAQYPFECSEIYAGFHRNDFFDAYDVHLHGANFLDAVLMVLAEPNNQRVRDYALSFAINNMGGCIMLAKLQIHNDDDLTTAIHRLFPPEHVNTFGLRMFGHIVFQLKSTLMAFSNDPKLVNAKGQLEKALPMPTAPLVVCQGPANRADLIPNMKNAKRTESGKELNKGNLKGSRASSAVQGTLHPPPVVPNHHAHSNGKAPDMRRTMSAEHHCDPNNNISRTKSDIVLKEVSRNVTGNWSHLNVPQGAVSVPQTPLLSASSSSAFVPPRQAGFHNSPSTVPSQALPLAYSDSFGQVHQPKAASRHSSAQSTRSPYLQHAPTASEAPMAPMHGQAPAFYPPGPQNMAVMPPMFYPNNGAPFQGQLPYGNPNPMNYAAMDSARYVHNQGMWDNTNQTMLSPPPVYSEYNHEFAGRYHQGDSRGGFGNKGNMRGHLSNGQSTGRGGSYPKSHAGRKVSVSSANYRGGRRNTHGSNQYPESVSNGTYGTDFGHAQMSAEPFPNFSHAPDQQNPGEIDLKHGCTPTFIGSERSDVVDLWVTGFSMRRNDFETGEMLKDLFSKVAGVKSVAIMHKDEKQVFAFVNFLTSDGARKGLTLEGDVSTGSQPLRVQVSDKYVQARKYSRSMSFGQRRMSDAHVPYHHRGTNDSHGSLGGPQPIYLSNDVAQSLGHMSPQSPHGTSARRSYQYHQQSHGPNPRKFPSGANAEFIQRLDTKRANENALKGSRIQYSPQDCRSSMPVPERNLEPNSSPERKKKNKKNRSPTKPGSETSSSVVQEQNTQKQSNKGKDTALTGDGKDPEWTGSPDGQAGNVTGDGKGEEPAQSAVGQEASDSATDEDSVLYSIKSRECDSIPETPEVESSQKPEVSVTNKDVADSVMDESRSLSSSTTLLASPLQTISPISSQENESLKQDSLVATPESKHRTEDSFHSAMEAQTPRAVSGTKEEGVESTPASPEEQPEVVQSIEDPIEPPTSKANEHDVALASEAKDSIDQQIAEGEIVLGATSQGKKEMDIIEVSPASERVVPRLEITPEPSTAPRDSARNSTSKVKSPKTSTPQQNQGALHPFAKANQAKQAKSKSQKKKEKKEKEKQKSKSIAKESVSGQEKQPNPVAPAPAVTVTVTEREPTPSEVELDVPTTAMSGSAMLETSVKENNEELKATEEPDVVLAKDEKNVATKEKEEDSNDKQGQKVIEQGSETDEVKPLPSPEKRSKGTYAQRVAKLVAMPDLSILRRKDANAAKK